MPIGHKIAPPVKEILNELSRHGYEAYLVGGAVRDLLLGIEPKDYDISTSARPEEIRKVFGRKRARIIGRRFRLVHLRADGDIYEISTFRREPSAEERSARAEDDGVMLWRDNVYGTVEQDAFRRDFTVNSIYYDLNGADGGILDFTGGVPDLEAHRVRMIGDEDRRLVEDPVRLLRALKLVSQYGFHLEEDLEQAIHRHADLIGRSSRARLFEELLKILAKPYSLAMLSVCREHGLLPRFWPNLDAIWDERQGELLRHMLASRDRRLDAGDYTLAKTLILATLSFVPVAESLGMSLPSGRLWEPEPGLERLCRNEILKFLEPFPVPRFLSARARDVILLMPRFFSREQPDRTLRHPEYKYARELFLILAEVFDWDHELVSAWPPPPPRSRRGGGRRSDRHRPRRPRKRRPRNS